MLATLTIIISVSITNKGVTIMKFIKLTKTPECETILLNLDFVYYIKPTEYGGSLIVNYVDRRGCSALYVLESFEEIYALINAK